MSLDFTEIEVIDERQVTTTREANSDDEWDRGCTHTKHNITGIKVSQYTDLSIPFKPQKGVPYYLAYAVYSTGDSFGNDDGQGIVYFDLFRIKEAARACADKAASASDDGFSYINESLETIRESYIPWLGYFERLCYTDVAEVYLEA